MMVKIVCNAEVLVLRDLPREPADSRELAALLRRAADALDEPLPGPTLLVPRVPRMVRY